MLGIEAAQRYGKGWTSLPSLSSRQNEVDVGAMQEHSNMIVNTSVAFWPDTLPHQAEAGKLKPILLLYLSILVQAPEIYPPTQAFDLRVACLTRFTSYIDQIRLYIIIGPSWRL